MTSVYESATNRENVEKEAFDEIWQYVCHCEEDRKMSVSIMLKCSPSKGNTKSSLFTNCTFIVTFDSSK